MESYSLEIRIDSVNQILKNKEKVTQNLGHIHLVYHFTVPLNVQTNTRKYENLSNLFHGQTKRL